MIVGTEQINGKQIEIHDKGFGKSRYWVMIDRMGLFQRGRMRMRTFTSVEAALKIARKEAERTPAPRKTRGAPGYANFGGGGPFAPMGSPTKAGDK